MPLQITAVGRTVLLTGESRKNGAIRFSAKKKADVCIPLFAENHKLHFVTQRRTPRLGEASSGVGGGENEEREGGKEMPNF